MTAKPNELDVGYEPAGEGSEAHAMSDSTNVDVIQRFYGAFGRGDIPAALDLLADDVEWTFQAPSVIPFAGTRRGREEVAEFFSLVGETLEFQQFEPLEFVGQGDTVVVLGFEHNLIIAHGPHV
jgi:ketosteroid isomerase-like protein